MTTLYRVFLNRGLRARTELGVFVSRDVAEYVATSTVTKTDQSTSVEPLEVDDAGSVSQYQADQQLQRIKDLLSPQDLELLRQRQGLL